MADTRTAPVDLPLPGDSDDDRPMLYIPEIDVSEWTSIMRHLFRLTNYFRHASFPSDDMEDDAADIRVLITDAVRLFVHLRVTVQQCRHVQQRALILRQRVTTTVRCHHSNMYQAVWNAASVYEGVTYMYICFLDRVSEDSSEAYYQLNQAVYDFYLIYRTQLVARARDVVGEIPFDDSSPS